MLGLIHVNKKGPLVIQWWQVHRKIKWWSGDTMVKSMQKCQLMIWWYNGDTYTVKIWVGDTMVPSIQKVKWWSGYTIVKSVQKGQLMIWWYYGDKYTESQVMIWWHYGNKYTERSSHDLVILWWQVHRNVKWWSGDTMVTRTQKDQLVIWWYSGDKYTEMSSDDLVILWWQVHRKSSDDLVILWWKVCRNVNWWSGDTMVTRTQSQIMGWWCYGAKYRESQVMISLYYGEKYAERSIDDLVILWWQVHRKSSDDLVTLWWQVHRKIKWRSGDIMGQVHRNVKWWSGDTMVTSTQKYQVMIWWYYGDKYTESQVVILWWQIHRKSSDDLVILWWQVHRKSSDDLVILWWQVHRKIEWWSGDTMVKTTQKCQVMIRKNNNNHWCSWAMSPIGVLEFLVVCWGENCLWNNHKYNSSSSHLECPIMRSTPHGSMIPGVTGKCLVVFNLLCWQWSP